MFLTFKKWTAFYLLTLLLLFAGFAAILWQGSAINASKNLTLGEGGGGTVLVVDPGHGGIDGGAVAADGTVEAQINLAVALQMEELARLVGVDIEMTRREDVSLHDSDAGTVRQKKASDLKNRAALANGVPGAQVFYNTVAGSQELAEAVQAVLNETLNARPKEAKAGSGVYLLEHSQIPSILVECGFLSNPQETALLCTPEYQRKLAVSVFSSVRACLR